MHVFSFEACVACSRHVCDAVVATVQEELESGAHGVQDS